MASKNQARKAIRRRLVDLDLSVTDLAKQVQHPRPTVSAAIHSDKFPRVRHKVREVLGV